MKEKFDTISNTISQCITKHYSTSFSLGIRLIHKNIRQDIYNIYGFVRLADEVVDSFHGYDKRSLLQELRSETFTAISRGISVNPILNSFQHTVNKYAIALDLVEDFLNSMEMDLEKVIYNAQEYNKYIYGSAEVVGLMCLQVFCEGDKEKYAELKPYAQKLGSAFQKINFLRDIQSDMDLLGRHYFPNVNLKSLSLPQKIKLEQEIEAEFCEALEGIKQLPANCRNGVYTAYTYYLQLLHKIKLLSVAELCNKRIRINNFHKIKLLVWNSWLRGI